MASKSKGLRVIDDPTVKELFSNKFICSIFDNGSVSITMGTTRYLPDTTDAAPHPGQRAQVHVTARLALSPAGAVELVNNLANLLNKLQQASQAPDQKSAGAGNPEEMAPSPS